LDLDYVVLLVFVDQEIIEWYTAIRSAKLNRLSVAYPNTDPTEVNKSS